MASDVSERIRLFCLKYLTHTKAPFTNQPFVLLDWQMDVLRSLFDTYKPNGLRQYNEAYIELPRKQGKTAFIAAVALYFLICGDIGEEIYVAASTRDQAGLLYNAIADFVYNNTALQKDIAIYKNRTIECKRKRSTLRVLSRDADSAHGLNPSIAICDELHTFPDSELFDVLKTGQLARPNRLLVSITTAGFNKQSFCYKKHEYAEGVADGSINDPHFYGKIYGLRDGDDWTDEAVWYRVNPSLGHTVGIDAMRAAFIQAKNSPTEENAFKTLQLNSWLSTNSTFIPYDIVAKCYDKEMDIADFIGENVYLGLDLSSTTDLTALSATFERDGAYYNFTWAFVPRDNIEKRSRVDKVPYLDWERDGVIIPTEGNVIDYRAIVDKIVWLKEQFNIVNLAIDRWGASQMVVMLQQEDVPVQGFGQGYSSMSVPTKAMQSAILSRNIKFNSVVTLWCFGNAVAEIDAAENIKLIKNSRKKNRERIDAAISSIMSLKLAMDDAGSAVHIGKVF